MSIIIPTRKQHRIQILAGTRVYFAEKWGANKYHYVYLRDFNMLVYHSIPDDVKDERRVKLEKLWDAAQLRHFEVYWQGQPKYRIVAFRNGES